MELDNATVNDLVNNIRRESVVTFPLYSNHCYFCLINESDCDKCEYAERHGKCGDDESVWKKLIHLQGMLKSRHHHKPDRTNAIVRRITKMMLSVNTIDELMELKKRLLIDLSYCYYEYNSKLEEFIAIIENEYWQGIEEDLDENWHGNEEDFIAFGDRIRINDRTDTILARVSDSLAAIVCLKDGNRWNDAVECKFIYHDKRGWGITTDEFESLLLDNRWGDKYTIEMRKENYGII